MFEFKIWNRDIPLFDENNNNDKNQNTNLITFFPAETEKPVPTVVIFPGGGYCLRSSEQEGFDVAKFFNSVGFNAAVVEYRVAPYHYPVQLLDAQRAIKVVRSLGKEYNVDTDKIVTLGFSAGGHLCGMTATFPDICNEYGDEIDKLSAHPNGAVLCYAVSSADKDFGHLGSFKNLLGENYEKKEEFSTELRIDKNTCPCFLWHTVTDECVNVENSIHFAQNLIKNNIPCELHLFPNGPHGQGLAQNLKEASQWPELAANWIKNTI